MLVNDDFSRRATVTPGEYRWMTSPQEGVDRVMLDRLGGEHARATSIVRYAAHSQFPRHDHPHGEEILVLSGTFSADGEHYPAGFYLRNPPGSSHTPYSAEGAVIFVKLRQMPAGENRRVCIDTRDASSWQRDGAREVCPLYSSATERVWLQRLAPGEAVLAEAVSGAELLVVSGLMVEREQHYEAGSWLRLPAGSYPAIAAGAGGATVYCKVGAFADSMGGR